MPKISCSVDSCFYNQDGICDANVLKIVGDKANITEQTSCSTYINNDKASNALDDEVPRGETEVIHCEVETCVYHDKDYCMLSSRGIEVGNLGQAESYEDTDCLSFDRRSY